MNYYQSKQQEALASCRAKVYEDYGRILPAMGFNLQTGKMVEPEMTEADLRYVLIEIKKLRLRYDAHILDKVVEMLDKSDSKKSPSCGCNGKSASAGKYETKSLSKGSTRHTKSNGLFASAYEQVQADAEYEAFCSKFPYMCNER